MPQIYVSPDKALRASVLPVDVSLYATPDMESRVVIRTKKGDTLTSKDYSSPRGTNGFYVYNAKWSPDSPVLRLQHDIVRRAFAVVVSDNGVQPPEEFNCEIQRHDRGGSRRCRGIFHFRDRTRSSPLPGSNRNS